MAVKLRSLKIKAITNPYRNRPCAFTRWAGERIWKMRPKKTTMIWPCLMMVRLTMIQLVCIMAALTNAISLTLDSLLLCISIKVKLPSPPFHPTTTTTKRDNSQLSGCYTNSQHLSQNVTHVQCLSLTLLILN